MNERQAILYVKSIKRHKRNVIINKIRKVAIGIIITGIVITIIGIAGQADYEAEFCGDIRGIDGNYYPTNNINCK